MSVSSTVCKCDKGRNHKVWVAIEASVGQPSLLIVALHRPLLTWRLEQESLTWENSLTIFLLTFL